MLLKENFENKINTLDNLEEPKYMQKYAILNYRFDFVVTNSQLAGHFSVVLLNKHYANAKSLFITNSLRLNSGK